MSLIKNFTDKGLYHLIESFIKLIALRSFPQPLLIMSLQKLNW